MISIRQTIQFILVAGGVISLSVFFPIKPGASAYHTKEELDFLRKYGHELLQIDSLKFTTATICEGCHGFDPDSIAMVDKDGHDINVWDDWSSSMMANSAKDPFWRAKVSHELEIHPQHADVLQHKCTSCHAPLGHYQAMLDGIEYYTLDHLDRDTVGLDGVNCGGCHQLSPADLGKYFSGKLNYDTNKIMYGPYPFPFAGPMNDFVGFEPRFSPHVLDSELCAGCHTLIVDPFDLNGNPTGTSYVEQATYHEWKNSRYQIENESCQSCHLPRIKDEVVLASLLQDLDPRTPFGLHEMAGANVFMLELMKNNRDTLGLRASEEAFDATIEATLHHLDHSVDLTMEELNFTGDTLKLSVGLKNHVGHKFPSGYPSRRAVVQLVLETYEGDTLFYSGRFDNGFSLIQEDIPYEPHHQRITEENQVQIYEIVPADSEGNFTTVLARAVTNLKDNRLPPEGFLTSHPSYDTVAIYGRAVQDPNFNVQNNIEGSGNDQVFYDIPIFTNAKWAKATVRLYYQSVPRKWVQNMFTFDTDPIQAFRDMYEGADHQPVLMASAELDSILLDHTSVKNHKQFVQWEIYPNPVRQNGSLQINTYFKNGFVLSIHDIHGRILHSMETHSSRVDLPVNMSPGIYLIHVFDNNTGKSGAKRILVQ